MRWVFPSQLRTPRYLETSRMTAPHTHTGHHVVLLEAWSGLQLGNDTKDVSEGAILQKCVAISHKLAHKEDVSNVASIGWRASTVTLARSCGAHTQCQLG